jgi:hypothetical protein
MGTTTWHKIVFTKYACDLVMCSCLYQFLLSYMYATIMYMKLLLHVLYLIFLFLYKHYSLKGIVCFIILTDGAAETASQPQSCPLEIAFSCSGRT